MRNGFLATAAVLVLGSIAVSGPVLGAGTGGIETPATGSPMGMGVSPGSMTTGTPGTGTTTIGPSTAPSTGGTRLLLPGGTTGMQPYPSTTPGALGNRSPGEAPLGTSGASGAPGG